MRRFRFYWNKVLQLCFLWCIVFVSTISAQDSYNLDPLLSELESAKTFVDSFQIIIKTGERYTTSLDQDTMVLYYYNKAMNFAKVRKRPMEIMDSYSKILPFLFQKGQQELAKKYLDEGVVAAKLYESEYPKGLAIIYRSFHIYSYYQADYSKMLEYGELALSYSIKEDDSKLLSFTYIDIGNAYYYLGDYQNALSYYIHSAKLYEAGENNSYQVYGNIADVYIILNQTDNAEEVLQKFLKACIQEKSSKEQNQKIAIIYYKLSKVALLNEDFDSALTYALQSIESNDNRYNSELIFANNYASSALSRLQRFPEALDYAFKASQMLEEFPDVGLEAEIENSIGNLYVEMGEGLEAKKHFQKSLNIAQRKGFVHLEMRSALELSKIQEDEGNYKNAFSNLETYIALKDSLFTLEKDQNISELQTKYETERKEFENANLKKNNELVQAQNQKYLIGGLVLAGVSLLLAFFYAQLQRVKNQLAIQNRTVAQKNNELTELDKIKSNFFANVSHELRTPLTLILGPLARLLKSKNLDNTEFTMLKLMEQNAGDLLKLINEILDLSKIEADKLELKERPIVLYLFIQKLLSSFESLAQKKSIDLLFEYQANTSLQIFTDTNKLGKVINNLISNACKFTANGGKVTLSICDNGNQLEFVVSDNGTGIHPEDLPHVFNRFYQSKQADAQAEGGTGIGLALVNEFVKLFGGTISVVSTLDEGSVFTFLIPKKEVMKSLETEDALLITALENNEDGIEGYKDDLNFEKGETSIPFDASKKHSVLIVEDNYHLREYIQLILGEHYNTEIAENGKVALDWLNRQSENNIYPDLIVSDIMMPVMNGIDFLSKIKSQTKFNAIPVVMLTAKASMESKLMALRIGVDDYMIKPFVEEELIARVDNLLKHGLAKKQYINADVQEVPTSFVVDEKSSLAPDTPEVAITNQRDLLWLEDVEHKILKHYTDFEFSLDRLSELIFLSPRQTRRRLKELTGLSFSHYIREVRLTEARRMLENEEVHAIKQLAYEVGLKDVKYFSQQFKKRFGKSPSAYLSS